jgi:hypothetical protein
MKADKIQITQIAKPPERPKLVSRSRCTTFKLEGGCWDCGNKTFRYYSTIFGKRYYQCEKCRAINH